MNRRTTMLTERPITEQDQELLDVLRNTYAQLGRSPTISEVPSAGKIKARFGFWKNALAAANLPLLNESKQQRLREKERMSVYEKE